MGSCGRHRVAWVGAPLGSPAGDAPAGYPLSAQTGGFFTFPSEGDEEDGDNGNARCEASRTPPAILIAAASLHLPRPLWWSPDLLPPPMCHKDGRLAHLLTAASSVDQSNVTVTGK